MRPERLLPAERFGSPCPPGHGSTSWSDLPRQARGLGAAGTGAGGAGLPTAPPPVPDHGALAPSPDPDQVSPEATAPPAQPGRTAEAVDGRAAVDDRPTSRQANVTAPPVTPPQAHTTPPQAHPTSPQAQTAPSQGRGPVPPQQVQQRGRRPVAGQPPQAAPAPSGPQGAAQPTEPDPSDESAGSWILVKACQAGDQSAFQELYSRYHEVVFRYVLFRLGDRSLAEDLTQETFLRALRRISSVSYQGRDIGAWFVTIARNLIFDHVKSSRYRLESTTADMVEHSPTTHGPEQQVIENATNSELLKAIDKLNPDQQDCIRMRFLQGLSVAETAQRMNRAEGAVKALQHRAVRRLAQLMPEGLR